MKTNVHIRRINSWRSSYNPLRGLTIQKVVSLLEQGERGEYADLQWLYRFIEKRDATLRALRHRRRSALLSLDWQIKTVADKELPAGATKEQAEKQAIALREAYDNLENIKEAIAFLHLAEFRGYAHLEKRYDADNPQNPIKRLEPVDQWNWLRPGGLYGDWRYNPEAASAGQGEEIDPAHFIIREVEDPIDEIAVIAFLRKSLSQKDWDGFVEVYGIPPKFIIGPANVPQGKEAEYQATAEAVASDASGYLPHGSDVKTVNAGLQGEPPFKSHLDYQDSQIVLAGTGGKLTMLNDPTGLGSGQSESHQDTFDAIAEAEAQEISEIFQRAIDLPILTARFQGQPPLAYFELSRVDEEDIDQILDHAVKAASAGFQVDPGELSERTGYKLTAAPALGPSSFTRLPLQNRQDNPAPSTQHPESSFLSEAKSLLAAAQAADLIPLGERIAAISRLSDSELPRALRQLRADLPQILRKVNANPATTAAFEKILGASLATGITEES